ncbi:MAG: 2-hydroxychromene-2-carboxylate isomerase [Rhodospirillales bacterium]|nr:2-hydroxychromene-2-carboxylate isomerase [Rhodospirillales bacterium]
MAIVEFWYEFASTYSYPAAMRIERLAAARGVRVAWKAFLLGPIFAAQGWADSPFNLYPAKGRYMWRDLERICAREGIALRRPSVFPRSGLVAARVACLNDEASWLPDFVRAVYGANFGEDRETDDAGVVASLLAGLGLPGDELIARAGSPDAKAALRRRNEEAAERGVFGAPTMFVGDEMFWGNDRLEDAFDWALKRSHEDPPPLPAGGDGGRAFKN